MSSAASSRSAVRSASWHRVKSSALFEALSILRRGSRRGRWVPSKDFPMELERRGFTKTRRGGGVIFQGIELRTEASDDRFGEG